MVSNGVKENGNNNDEPTNSTHGILLTLIITLHPPSAMSTLSVACAFSLLSGRRHW
jgi:hypothetical protein